MIDKYLASAKRRLIFARNFMVKKTFLFSEKYFRLHITPVHFYSPIPNVGELDHDIYAKVNDCAGIDLSAEDQYKSIEPVFRQYIGEYLPPSQGGLSQVDAFVLYAIVRSRKPKLMVEIGSGESTRISLEAVQRNREDGCPCAFIAIDPYPKKYLKSIGYDHFRLVEKKVQDVDLGLFSNADILFIDSSHVSKIGSDVNYEIFDIVPRLKVGALVHWHDIMIPGEYSRNWIESGTKFWNESYMVHAFMMFNRSFRILWASKYMQLNSPKRLSEIFPYFSPDDPDQQLSSFWIERVG